MRSFGGHAEYEYESTEMTRVQYNLKAVDNIGTEATALLRRPSSSPLIT
jgi:hypothetical protein